MKPLGILFLGGAKRVAMAQMLKRSAAGRGYDCRITGYELDSHSALALEGDVVEGLRWSDSDILPHIDNVVQEKNIDIIIPFVDPAVGIAADYIAAYGTVRGIFAPVSPRAVADVMYDKVSAAEFFENHAIPVPATWRQGAPCGKLIAKPRYGSASKGIVAIDSLPRLYEILGRGTDKYLVQERIDNREEITVDCYVGVRSGTVACVSPRLRGEVSGGEAVRTETIAEEAVNILARHVLAVTGLRGAVTVQIIRDLDSDRLMVMEVNPRLGGGAVASVHAGADIPGLIIDDFAGNSLAAQYPSAGVETVRYLADMVFYP